MNKKLRKENLLPNGIPKYVRIYDNLGTEKETMDRFTVVYSGNYRKRLPNGSGYRFNCDYQYVGMSSNPFSPLGFGQHGESEKIIDLDKWGFPPKMGRKNHLGKRIPFSELPPDCKKLVLSDYKEIWGL